MATKRVTDLTAITGANTATDDEFLIWDKDAATHKKITRAEFKVALEAAFSLAGFNVGGTTFWATAGQGGQFSGDVNSNSGERGQLALTGAADRNKALWLGYDTTNDHGIVQAVKTGTSVMNLVLQKHGGLTGFGGTPTQGKLEAIGVDGAILFGVKGTTKGLRVLTTASYLQLDGVDNSLVTSYQPIVLNGATTTLAVSGINICQAFISGFKPTADASFNLGDPSFRWGTVYAATGTINTSGREAKLFIGEASDAEKRAARRVRGLVRRYKLKDSVDKKGDAARWHFGFVAEDVRDALAAEGLDPWAYGFLCADPVTVTETYTVEVERPMTRKVATEENVVEVRDGKPVRMRRQVERDEPVGSMQPVIDEDGSPVMIEARDDKGEIVLAPLLHFVPEMEAVEETRTREVETGKTRFGLRYSELEAFLRCAD